MTTSAADMPVRPFAALCLLAMTSACIPAGAPPNFYASAAEKPGARHGALIRYEPLPRSPTGAHAYRIIYQSTDTAGRLIAVSGMVIVPDGPAPAGGRP